MLTPQIKTISKHISQAGTLSRIVVDETHFVDTWGNDFRPSYLNLALFKDYTNVTAQHITGSLKHIDPVIIKLSLDRANLVFKVVDKKELKSMDSVSEMINTEFN